MGRFISLLLYLGVLTGCLALATEPQERTVESLLPALPYGGECWSSLDLHNLGDRPVIVDVEAHRASGALVSLKDHPQMTLSLKPGASASYRLEIEEETGDAWVRIREHVPSQRLWPVVAVSGTSECVSGNHLQTTAREVAYPARNPWFAGDIAEMPGNVIAAVNTSEHAATVYLCYSSGNLYSVPTRTQTNPPLAPICSQSIAVQLPPFGARQFPVQRAGNSYFSLKTQGDAMVLQMLRPVAGGVRTYTVDSTIKFEQ